jgi:hypothetical protein
MDKSRWKKMEDLYESALQLPETERARFLDANCAEDASMRDELDSLLSSSGESDGFLSEGGFELGIQLLGSPGRVFQSGQDFGRFKIIDLLGRGGMGEVYLAEDSRLGRSVALKILPNAIADDEGVRRLLQEARTASALNHPNILTIYDVGEIEGRIFISLEFI